MIKVCELKKSFGDKVIFDGFTAEFEKGSRTLITGSSGIGKTTLLRIIAGLEGYDGGEVVIPAEYKGRPVRMTEQPRYPEDAEISEITSLIIPEGVRRICGEAHQYYSRLRTVTLPDTLTEIGRFAFADCDELRELKLPGGLKVIEECAFSECAALERVELPDGLLRIENQAFRYCTSLESVSVPPTVTEIDYEAFFGCSALREVTLSAETRLGDDAIPDGVEIVCAD